MGTITAFPIPTFNIPTLPDVSPVSDASQFVMERSGTGRVNATALRDYIAAFINANLPPKTRAQFNVLDYEATGDGTTDDTTAFATALAAAAVNGGTVYVPMPEVAYKISSGLTVPAKVSVIGDESRPTITTTAATFNLFNITGSDVSIANFTIQNAAKTGGVDFFINTGSTPIERICIDWIESFSPWGCIADTGTGTTYYVSLYLRRIRARGNRGAAGFDLRRILAFLVVEDCLVDVIGTASPASDFACYNLDNTSIIGAASVGGSIWRGCFAAGNSRGAAVTNNWGFNFNNTAEVWMSDCDADSVDGHGFSFNLTNHLHLDNCQASLCNGHGFVFNAVGFSEGANVRVYGRRQAGIGGAAGAHGIAFLATCQQISFSNTVVWGPVGDGVFCPVQIGPINFTGGRVNDAGGIGINVSGTHGFLAVGMQLTVNVGGNYSLGGANQYIQATQKNDGTIINVGPGPVSG